jgi:hypothetical protein
MAINEHVASPPEAAIASEHLVDIWASRLSFVPSETPRLAFYEGNCLEFEKVEFDCAVGMYFEESNTVQILNNNQWKSILAHELLHWGFEQLNNGIDENHLRPEWQDVQEVRFEMLTEYGI